MESFDKKATYLLIGITLIFVAMLLIIGTGGFK
jgi:hypothetical protein